MALSAPQPGDARTDATAGAPPDPTAGPQPGHAPAGAPRNPLLAALGAGDATVAVVARAFADAVEAAASTATSTRETVQQRVADLPAELDELRDRFSGEELRRALDAYRAQVGRAYAALAGRGEQTWGRLRERPRVVVTRLGSYTEVLDARVDHLVDDAQGAASWALAAAGRQGRVAGERVARAGQRFTGLAADVIVDASAAAADAVEEVGTAAAGRVEEAGDEVAAVTRATAVAADAAAGPGGGADPGGREPGRRGRASSPDTP
jgi:heparin binding hemagglutinin HbhA